MKVKGLLFGGALAVLVVLLISFGLYGSSEQTTFTSDETTVYSDHGSYVGSPVPGFTPIEARQLTDRLAEVERRNGGVCFGWKLTDGGDGDVQRGSSRGPNVPADTCRRWVETQVFVAYDLDLDAADVRVAASPDIAQLPNRQDYVDLGITADALVAEPSTATGQAAMATPLLLVQTGALPVPPAQNGQPGGAPSQPLPAGDGSGSSTAVWIWLVVLVLVMVAAVVLGFRARSKQRRNDPPRPPQGPPQGPPPPGPPPQGRPPQGPPPGPPGYPQGPFAGRPPQGPPPGFPPPGHPPQGPPPAGPAR